MVDKTRQSGRPSRFAYAKQSVLGTYQAPTDIWNASNWDVKTEANVEHYETLNGNLFAVSESREGIQKLTATGSGPFRGRQAIGLIAACIGTDTLSSAGASTSLGTVGVAGSLAGAQDIPLTGALTAPPAGIADWGGATFTIGTGGTLEDVGVLAYTSTHLYTTPTKFAHLSTETIVVNKQHCLQMNTGATAATLSPYSIVAQWAQETEQQAKDALIYMLGLKSDSKNWTLDLSAFINSALNFDGDVTTTVTPSASELADRPFKAQDAFFGTYGAAADIYMKPHTRYTALDFKFQYAIQEVTEGGNPQAVVQGIVGKASAEVSFTDNAGEANFSTFRTDFVVGGLTTPAMIWMKNKVTADCASVFMPLCSADMYDNVGPSDKPVERQGKLTVMLDQAVTGVPLRLWIKNPVTTAY